MWTWLKAWHATERQKVWAFLTEATCMLVSGSFNCY